ncbi:MAG: type II toxin-antitoxin system prevent-host-death family antitoxin [Chloroflexi bacterium]|nr:type II toxin-antitoxin system prevent-host-death family antitoxin [Chloroflexota bacterium]
MTETYSTYDAKAKLSEILRKVEEGRTIYISRRGEPIAEIRPIQAKPVTLAERIVELKARGVLTEPVKPRAPMRPIAHLPGALAEFLADRNE